MSAPPDIARQTYVKEIMRATTSSLAQQLLYAHVRQRLLRNNDVLVTRQFAHGWFRVREVMAAYQPILHVIGGTRA